MTKTTKQTPRDSVRPVKATNRMAPQYSAYAEGRKPNVGGDAVKRPNADHKENRATRREKDK